MTDAMQCQRLTVAVNKHFRRFVLKKERILFFIYKSVRRTPQIKFPPSSRVSPTAVPPLHSLREPTASDPRGATLSTRIDRDIFLLMPLRFVRQLRTQTAQSLVLSVKLGVRFLAALRLAFSLQIGTYRL